MGFQHRIVHMSIRLADGIEDEKAQRPGARNDPRLDWWRKAKFGAFIHWGLYCLPDRWRDRPEPPHHWTKEWMMEVRRVSKTDYAALASDFNPTAFNADEWLDLFERAGQKYVVFTAKHHDGFCMFHSRHTPYNIVDSTPFGRDVVAELSSACAKRKMPFGLYYSQTQDWYHPDGHGNHWDFNPDTKNFSRYLDTCVKPHLHEILTGYGPIALIWFDTPKIITRQQSQELLDLVHTLQPHCLVNGRIGNGMGDYATTRDNEYLSTEVNQDWECPATMNDTWGYLETDQNWKTAEQLFANYRRVREKNGNFLLNYGPDPSGIIPQPCYPIMETLGQLIESFEKENVI